MNQIQYGKRGEEIATKYLIEHDYSIYGKNFRCRLGEIDIIAIDKIEQNELVFIEVKTRKQNQYGTPAEAVNDRKIFHLYHVAEYFLMIHHLENLYVRFDVIEILELSLGCYQINHIKNAITDQKMLSKGR